MQALSFPLSNLDAFAWHEEPLMAPIATALSVISVSGFEHWGTESLQLYATGVALVWLTAAVLGACGLILWALLERSVPPATVKVTDVLRTVSMLSGGWVGFSVLL